MKKLIVLLCAILLAACQQQEKQYFEASPEIDLIKKGNQAYLAQDWTTLRSIYADTAKISNNTWDDENLITADQFIDGLKQNVMNQTEIKIGDDGVFSMVVTNEGHKYVLAWFKWSAKTKGGKDYSTPIHIASRVVGDKVAWQAFILNNLPAHLAMEAEAMQDSTASN